LGKMLLSSKEGVAPIVENQNYGATKKRSHGEGAHKHSRPVMESTRERKKKGAKPLKIEFPQGRYIKGCSTEQAQKDWEEEDMAGKGPPSGIIEKRMEGEKKIGGIRRGKRVDIVLWPIRTAKRWRGR